IERMVQSSFHKREIPSGKDVCRKQFYTFMDKLLQVDISPGGYESYVPMLEEKFSEVSKEDILKRLTAMEFDRFLKFYENAEDLNIRERIREPFTRERAGAGTSRDQRTHTRDSREPRQREYNSNGNGDSTRLFVTLGTK